MKPLLLTTLAALFVSRILSQATNQAILPSTLPACAQSCPNLVQGQTACIAPPNPAPGGTYGVQCLCGFAPLASLNAAAPVQLCATCSASENAAIQSWYQGACASPAGSAPNANGQNGQNGQTTTAVIPSSTSLTTPSTTTRVQAPTVSSQPATAPAADNKDWISTHWRWVLMLIILVLGLTGLAVGGVYLRRHIHRRREARNFGVAGSRQDLETWGPGQSVHDFGAAGAASGAPANEKGKEREGVENPTAANDRKLSRRLTKGWIPGKKR
ncbi:MAG: hypothetical protein LQ345_002073 [Seirophora villosa]|nr:MAG: hypothetical protein LQ345_002073 [Seirophora villosa]